MYKLIHVILLTIAITMLVALFAYMGVDILNKM